MPGVRGDRSRTGRLTGRRALDQHLADAFLEQLDALADRRRRDVQLARRGFKSAFADDHRKSGQLGVIDLHRLNILTHH